MEDKGMGNQEQCGQSPTDIIQRDPRNLGLGWSVEAAEIAAQDRTVCKILTSQAVCVDMHDADW